MQNADQALICMEVLEVCFTSSLMRMSPRTQPCRLLSILVWVWISPGVCCEIPLTGEQRELPKLSSHILAALLHSLGPLWH